MPGGGCACARDNNSQRYKMPKEEDTTGSRFVPVEKTLLHTSDDKRQIAIDRCDSYTEAIRDYLDARDQIPCGLTMVEELAEGKARVLEALGGTETSSSTYRISPAEASRGTKSTLNCR